MLLSLPFGSSVSISFHWVLLTMGLHIFAFAAHTFSLDGIPDEISGYHRFTPLQALRTSRVPGGDAVTMALMGSD